MKCMFRVMALIIFACSLVGCGGKVEVIDLNKVMSIYSQVLKTDAPEGKKLNVQTVGAVKELRKNQVDEKLTAELMKRFADALNKAKLISKPIGVMMRQDGVIVGYTDSNKNMKKDSRDADLFTIEMDANGNRLIATQQVAGQTYRRDHGYHHRSYGGSYWYYYGMGSMWRRQNDYYDRSSFASTRTRPNYSGMRMSPTNYHSSAVSRARASTRSARSSGGSRGFSRGK
ncbi:hypothetical protein JD969_17850 [Planctomycetota bacterium]|nr:hypothetical protein JD969_17850 [Planctomycetota bacterium]